MLIDAVTLDSLSRVLMWTAVSIYVLAFIAYAVDLADRSQASIARKDARVAVLAGAEATGSVAHDPAPEGAPKRYVWGRIGTSLTWLGFVMHAAAAVLRGIGAGRVPWANMYEFAMTGTLLVIAVYLGVLFWRDLRFLGAFVTGLVTILAGSAMMLHVEIVPLMDPLKSIWLIIHVFVASLATAFFALAFALSVMQLLQARREAKPGEGASRSLLRTIPSAEALEALAYRFAIIGFIFWTFTLIAGAIWANESWGRYWGFDTKEVWTFIIWVIYAGYIHARATRGWRGSRSAWLSIVGFAGVLFNFVVVNVFFEGLHAYSGLS